MGAHDDRSVAVVGAGYVGLTTALCLGSKGFRIRCVDTDVDRISRLARGECPIHEAGLQTLLDDAREGGRIEFSVDPETVLPGAGLILLCVPTPAGQGGRPDLQHLLRAARAVADHASAGSVVVNRSTSPPGTAETLRIEMGRADLYVAANPEFLREGSAVRDFLAPDRIVIGTTGPEAESRIARMYQGFDAPLVLTDPLSAELIKYASNAFLGIKLSYVNEVATLCERMGADSSAVFGAMGLDPRIGGALLSPGPGWGGSCIPKDSRALVGMANDIGIGFPLVEAALETNLRHVERVVARISASLGQELDGARIAVWGLAFKAGTDDIRESPSIAVIERLVGAGAVVSAFDPAVRQIDTEHPRVRLAVDELDAVEGAELLVVLTEWPQFGLIGPDEVASRMAAHRVLDLRGVLDANEYTIAGLVLDRIGRSVDFGARENHGNA